MGETSLPESQLGVGVSACPKEVLEYLGTQIGSLAVKSIRVQELQSAQHQVLLLQFSHLSKNNNNGNNSPTVALCDDDDDDAWNQALMNGSGRLIVRIWEGSSRWWNLHNQEEATATVTELSLQELARSEVAGYRIARRAFQQTCDYSDAIRIPAVLAFSLELSEVTGVVVQSVGSRCWAVMEYVGQQSTHFGQSTSNNNKWDDSWSTGMIKVRDEFGFTEPHPRWGRVPVDECLEYTLAVLRQVTLPLHRYLGRNSHALVPAIKGLAGIQTMKRTAPSSGNDTDTVLRGYTYIYMVQLYQTAHSRMKQALRDPDASLNNAVRLLGKATAQLYKEAVTYNSEHEPLPPVLVHMDCQPQNLLFARTGTTAHVSGASKTAATAASKSKDHISSVLDWEEAAFADPRFELLLLCRKVCANRQQADQVWKVYQEELPQPNLGPIEPWLKLETVHSITTLLLQSMDLLGGGRSPWETKPDLWGKIRREFCRLQSAGWDFCDVEALETATV